MLRRCPPFAVLLMLCMAGCGSVQPYSAPPRAVTPVPTATSELETQPASPSTPVEPAQPLPPATTRNYSLNAASRALVGQADTQRKTGNFVQAAATLERALRIEPSNPLLWLAYAELRLDEGNFAQADSMGRKAIASAQGDPRTQAKAWRVVAESLKSRNKNSEAQQAYARATALVGG